MQKVKIVKSAQKAQVKAPAQVQVVKIKPKQGAPVAKQAAPHKVVEAKPVVKTTQAVVTQQAPVQQPVKTVQPAKKVQPVQAEKVVEEKAPVPEKEKKEQPVT